VVAATKVIKTGPDRPVGPIEPGTGPASGPVRVQNRFVREPALNRENREKTGDPAGLAVWNFFLFIFFRFQSFF
jgi:hypothetical protein